MILLNQMKNQNKKIVLGTAELGMKYGLNNILGQPTKEDSFSILDKAFASGIDTFDSAWAYGNAEDLLGEWLKERSLVGKIKIISKMKPHALNDYPDGTKAEEIVMAEIGKSLKRLGVDFLDGYLLHSPYYIYSTHVIDGLKKAKEKGLIKNYGVSTYDEPEALQAVELGVDYIQIPYNVFDQRLDSTDFFDSAKKNNVTVFARSPFLKGLLLMKPEELPQHLKHIGPDLERFISISKKYNITPLEAALCFVDKECRADHIVYGVNTEKELEENIEIMDKISKINHNELIKEIKDNFRDLNRGAINPSLWSKIKR